MLDWVDGASAKGGAGPTLLAALNLRQMRSAPPAPTVPWPALPGEAGWIVVDADEAARRPAMALGDPAILVLDPEGRLPALDPVVGDVFLTCAPAPPRPWVACADVEAEARALQTAMEAQPIAAAILVDLLRTTEHLDFASALFAESLAYSTLLGGDAFRRWRAATPDRGRAASPDPVRIERRDEALEIVLDDPLNRNAISLSLRDALANAFDVALLDPDIRSVILSGAGPVFCSGGHLDEFGRSTDLALAHQVRMRQYAAHKAHKLRDRLTARVHRAVIGGGLEVAAAAGRVEACADTLFRLPELAMGLIPGAGGTASAARRIGRHRTAYMALTGRDIDTATALHWGLVDAVLEEGW